MRLGELLLAEGLVSKAALEEALESQVVHGGRLGTNLVELGLLSEADLARALGKLHGCAHASGELTPDPAALALVDLAEADDKEFLPMRVDATRLSLAVVNPQDLGTFDTLAFRTGKRVMPVVIPEFRMNLLLRRYAHAFRPLRAIDLEVVRGGRATAPAPAAEVPRASPPPAASAHQDGPFGHAGGDLLSEDEFQNVYAQALGGGAPPAAEPGELVLDVNDLLLPEPTEAAPSAAPQPPAPAPEPEAEVIALPTPLTFAQAQAELARSQDREDVAATVLRFALGKWKRCLLLSVQGPLVTGWRGLGHGVREAAVRRIGIALRPGSTFHLVHQTRSHYIGPVKKDAGAHVFYKLLGGGYPTTAVILPLLVRGRLVHLLYVDNGPGQLTPPDVGELLILSQSVARSYEAMIRRRKSGG